MSELINSPFIKVCSSLCHGLKGGFLSSLSPWVLRAAYVVATLMICTAGVSLPSLVIDWGGWGGGTVKLSFSAHAVKQRMLVNYFSDLYQLLNDQVTEESAKNVHHCILFMLIRCWVAGYEYNSFSTRALAP